MNLAIVYDGSIRDNGTPHLFRFALAKVLGRQVPWYSEAGKIPEGHDFYLHIDDGRDDLESVPPHPWGYYATDTHIGPGPRLEKAKKADVVWCAQKPAAEEYLRLGLNAHWLPLACSPAHHPTAVELAELENKPLAEKKHDLVFVGHLPDPEKSSRINFLESLRLAFPSFWFRYGVFHHDMAREYHLAKIGVNHAVADDLNMRFFELASLGVPQLCDKRMVGLEELGFLPGVDFIGYSSPEEAVGGVKKYLDHPQLSAMVQNAKAKVRASHTYEHRIKVILADMEAVSC